MQARMGNPALIVPGAMEALQALSATAGRAGIPAALLELINLRVSQINGCAVCAHMHARDLRKAGESNERIDTVAAFRDTPWFSDAERSALALAEAATRVSDRPDAVPDQVWDEAAKHWNEQQLGALMISIASINVWNRLNLATRQEAGAAW
ncbi:carboxymuconolactone decarboxylase family protein [Streptacidiphilus sp. N1-12]|uniref:Carboxymuconolactone decarboxylase family protein n=2 Tax=Streptacidiphilus alkalitolerans TaxID=3342712 RepID=A0ABV6VHD2_9ACTN